LLIIVEGKNDKKALEKLGFKNIIVLHGRPLYSKIDEIISKTKKLKELKDLIASKRSMELGELRGSEELRSLGECIILIDFDKKGKEFYYRLKKELVKMGVIINDGLRKAILKERVSHIEGLATFIENKHYKQATQTI